MIGIAEIKRIIPHRFPVLLIDRVGEVEAGKRLTAYKAVTGCEACYRELDDDAGPEDYAYPISLVLESWAQAAVLLAGWERPNPDVLADKAELLSMIGKTRLLAPVFPGDVIEHRVRLVRAVDDAAICTGAAFVGDQKILEVGTYTLARSRVGALASGSDGK